MAGKRGSSRDDDQNPEQQSTDEVRTALISGNTFRAKAVQYSVVDGMAMFEGDIILGTVEEVEQNTEILKAETSGQLAAAVLITGSQYRWPNCVVPYTIQSGLTNQQRVTDAIAHWEANTRFRFVVRTTEANYVTFRPSTGCSSMVGMRTGQQFINLATGCTTGNTIHEIGHAVGFWHEQSREDRDSFITINWAKIQVGYSHNFNQHISDGDDVGPYDYGSIMHYGPTAFSVDGTPTITPLDPTATIGQRVGLSPGDIAAANSMCPKVLKELIKDSIKDSIFDTRKEVVKDIQLETKKELVLDTQKEMIKDRIKEVAYDPPWNKTLVERVTPIEPVIQPGIRTTITPTTTVQPTIQPTTTTRTTLPFAVVTPHHAPEAAVAAQLESAIPSLDAQLQSLADQLAQLESMRQQMQAQYDETAGLLKQALDAHDAAGG